tara:strand:- start:28 stop:363 length:336 start_codon:yes stop_codon:yes gene_type:complete
MNIHPLWAICLATRIGLAFIVKNFGNKSKIYRRLLLSLLLFIGIPWIFKAYYGSNNEVQIAKVFWHETRYIHAILYILAAIYLYRNMVNISTIIILTDVAFSILYRMLEYK